MPTTLEQALVDVRKRADLSQADVARIVDITQPIVSLRESGRRRTPAEDLSTLAQATGLTIAATPDGWQVLDAVPRQRSDPWREEPATPQTREQVELMVFGRVSAGAGIVNYDGGQWLDLVDIWRRSIDGVAQVTGDSMEPLLRDGDWVGVRLHEMPRVGDIAVFRNGWHDEVQIKGWGGEFGDEAVLRSVNPRYGLVRHPMAQLDVLGVAVGLLRPGRLRAEW